MTNELKINNYKFFFADQIKEEIDEQKKVNRTRMNQLFKSGDLSLAFVDTVQRETGMIILKFPRRMAPRLKVQKNIVVITKKARKELGEKPTEWSCSWQEFCSNSDFHTPGSDIIPMHYVNGYNDGFDYVACCGLSTTMYGILEKSVSEGKSLTVIIHDPFPPIDYFFNLSRYMDVYPDNEELYMEPLIPFEEWEPEELAFDEHNPEGISQRILKTLEDEDICIVQGPPGTGKSWTIAKIVETYLLNGKNVCVTTMANKGLIELIKQEPLRANIQAERISKTNLSIDEAKQIRGVKKATADLSINSGELLCATNYVLSSVYSEKKLSLNGLPSYDLIVIEEASQAFLTTIVAFKRLGKKCLIVGDPMQLPPIVKLNNPIYNTWNVNTQVEGLKTFALGSNAKAFRIVTTFRLTDKSAGLTKIFYGNRFLSVKKEYLDFSLIRNQLFPNEGGVLFCCTNDVKNGLYSDSADKLIRTVIDSIEAHYPERSLAIMTPFRDTVKELQKRFSTSDLDFDLTIETIDRIQGMTVDYAILYIPGRNPGFALEERRFNVATSRSRSTTLIISDVDLHNFHTIPPRVIKFIDMCDVIRKGTNISDDAKIVIEQQILPEEKPQIGVTVVGKIDLSKFERPKKEIKKDKKNYYIIDTNVFVDYPDIISKIDRVYPIILSAKVTDELDRMKIKLDEKGKHNAEKALRNLNNENQHKIIYEFADVTLLPDDFDKHSPDNMILSVALKYKKENPIMLTSDNGLQLKSKILGIATISLKNFMKK